MRAVELVDVVKRYGAVEVVHQVSLAVEPGQFVVLVGPSGCGKSTTLRMIAGLEEISSGALSINGKQVNRVAPKDRDVAMVFQNYALYPHLNVFENIAFGLRVRGEKRDVIASAVAEAASILGLTEYLGRKPADLSGGQRQRVAMGRAIVRKPRVFLFDEPLSNLDAKLRTHMRAEIKRLHRRLNVTSIYVTHDQVEAMTLADRIVIMNAGRIEQVGTPMEVFLRPANTFVAGFIGSPPMNLFDACLEERGGRLAAILDDGQAVALPAGLTAEAEPGHRVKLGIRPECFRVADREDGERLHCAVEIVEPLGAEALLHARASEHPFVAKVDALAAGGDLETVTSLAIDSERLYLFDAATGLAIGARPAEAPCQRAS